MLSSLKSQDTSKVFTTLASIAASAILVRTIYEVRRHFFTSNYKSSPYFSRRKTIIIEEHKEDDLLNKEFQAVDAYLVNEVSSSVSRLKVRKDEDMKRLVTNLEINEEIVDIFKNVEARWRLILKHEMSDQGRHAKYMKSYELTFNKKHEQMVLNSYLPYIMERGKAIREESKVIKLYPVDFASGVSEYTFNFDHPITFETLAVDSELKKAVLDDLNTFMNAEEYYRNSSKKWKRCYLIYGPPGTGKSSLTAAMANHLKYDIYDLDVSEFDNNPDYLERWLIPGLPSRTVVVVEDIDCTIKPQNQGEKKVRINILQCIAI